MVKEASKKAKKLRLDPAAPTVVDLQESQPVPTPKAMPDPGNASDLKLKLAARIEELRKKRGIEVTEPAKSRQELLEKRRVKKNERQKALLKKKDNRKMALDTTV